MRCRPCGSSACGASSPATRPTLSSPSSLDRLALQACTHAHHVPLHAGKTYKLEANTDKGRSTLHSGNVGFHRMEWVVEEADLEGPEPWVRLSYTSGDGEQVRGRGACRAAAAERLGAPSPLAVLPELAPVAWHDNPRLCRCVWATGAVLTLLPLPPLLQGFPGGLYLQVTYKLTANNELVHGVWTALAARAASRTAVPCFAGWATHLSEVTHRHLLAPFSGSPSQPFSGSPAAVLKLSPSLLRRHPCHR